MRGTRGARARNSTAAALRSGSLHSVHMFMLWGCSAAHRQLALCPHVHAVGLVWQRAPRSCMHARPIQRRARLHMQAGRWMRLFLGFPAHRAPSLLTQNRACCSENCRRNSQACGGALDASLRGLSSAPHAVAQQNCACCCENRFSAQQARRSKSLRRHRAAAAAATSCIAPSAVLPSDAPAAHLITRSPDHGRGVSR